MFSYKNFTVLNPLSAIGKYTDHWKFNLFMVLDPWTPRSSATHAPERGLISTDASPKIANFIK